MPTYRFVYSVTRSPAALKRQAGSKSKKITNHGISVTIKFLNKTSQYGKLKFTD